MPGELQKQTVKWNGKKEVLDLQRVALSNVDKQKKVKGAVPVSHQDLSQPFIFPEANLMQNGLETNIAVEAAGNDLTVK